MILGLGIDIIEISRIDDSIRKFAEAFTDRIYTVNEQHERADRTYFAGRWAAKEAVSKALGCGIGKDCSWLDIEILNTPSGAPSARLSGAAEARFRAINGVSLHVSISHERTNAVAIAVIEG
jgi:holo-[acyl-carrier protein] synthase